jgi:hypothetical protein
MREFAQRQFDRGGLNQRNALAAYSAAYGAIVNGDPRDVQSSLAIGSAFNVLAGPGSRAGEAGTAMLLSQLAASDLPSDEVMRRVNAASSFVIDAKRDAARYGLEQAMLNRLDRVNLWNAPAMQAGSEVASIWGAAQVNGLRQPARVVPSSRTKDTDFDLRVAKGVQTFRNLAPNDEIVPAVLFPASQVQKVGYSGRLTYVVQESGELVIGRTPHTSLSRGADVLAAGEVRFVNGTLRSIDNASGHYRPNGTAAQDAAETAFGRAGFDASGKYIQREF